MLEGELVNVAAPANAEALDAGAVDVPVDEIGQLDDEAATLLKELEASQLEVQRMIDAQREQASELGGMKESLASELQQLQDEAWKLQVFAELEMLKRQLAAINSLDADLDAMEARLEEAGEEEPLGEDFLKDLEAARVGTRHMLSKLAASNGLPPVGDGDADGDHATARPGGASTLAAAEEPAGRRAGGGGEESGGGGEGGEEDVEALQDALDAELAAMYKQLQDIKAESALVAARKAQLEAELMQLIQDGADELATKLKEMDVEVEDGGGGDGDVGGKADEDGEREAQGGTKATMAIAVEAEAAAGGAGDA